MALKGDRLARGDVPGDVPVDDGRSAGDVGLDRGALADDEDVVRRHGAAEGAVDLHGALEEELAVDVRLLAEEDAQHLAGDRARHLDGALEPQLLAHFVGGRLLGDLGLSHGATSSRSSRQTENVRRTAAGTAPR